MTDVAHLPERIQDIIVESRGRHHSLSSEDRDRIGKEGYTSPYPELSHDAIVALALSKNVLLQGPTGSGKTRFAEWLSNVFQQPMHMVNCSVDLDAEALLGFKTIEHKGGEASITFIAGPVIQAMEKGQLLYIDEINMAKPETLPILNGILDYRRRITNPFTGEIVQAAKGFRVVAAINLGYIGTVPLNEALKNRFITLQVPYLQGDLLKNLIKEHSILTDEISIDMLVKLSADLIFQTENGMLAEEAASVRALLDAADLAVYLPIGRAIERAIVDKLEEDRERSLVRNIVDTLV
jgi:nitric oxide reductase NorQ protein